MDSEQEQLRALSYVCPTCNSGRGKKCRTLLGKLETNNAHETRLKIVRRCAEVNDQLRRII